MTTDEDTTHQAVARPNASLLEGATADASSYEDTRPRGRSPAPDQHRSHGHHGHESFPKIEDVPPAPYGGADYGQLDIEQNGMATGARVAEDGRIDIKINQRSRKLTNLLVPALRQQLDIQREQESKPQIPAGLGDADDNLPPPPMNIVIQIVGSRGDVQPFVALGQVLKKKYNHRVRIATHPTFRDFVTQNELEFFSIGGDPSELMAFMVKNPGLMPGIDSLKNGDVGKRRKGIYEMINGCWRSCVEAGDGSGVGPSDDQVSDRNSFDGGIMFGADTMKPFIADAIIANPPSFAHMHIAEKLGIPLHLMFTMPWSPTQAFPHPLANIKISNADANMTNFITYALVDMLTWQGLGDVINRFRVKTLGLEPVSIMWAPGMSSRLRIPWTYCWSPALIPKPRDWGNYIDISGFYFLNLASDYTPPPDLVDFLAAGPPPVYIGFGSIVVDDPNGMTKMIFDAVKETGQRALVSKGWGGLGADELGIPEGVFMLGNCPHDWLFKQVSCVVHHGGAGTTAAGIAAGRPTVVVPFFGDQPFWGAMTARAGAGPPPVPFKTINSQKLADAIKEALKPESLERAAGLSAQIRDEKGTESGADSFHKQLHITDLRCSVFPERVAVWRIKRTDIRLSALAATVLGNEGLIDFTDLKLYRAREYETEEGPWDPISGGAAALIGTIGNLSMGVADIPVEILKSLRTASGEVKDAHKKDKSKPPSTSNSSLSQVQKEQSSRPSFSEDPSMESLSSTVTTSTVTSETATEGTPGSTTPENVVASPSIDSMVSRKPSAMGSVMSADGIHRRFSRRGSRSASPYGRRDHTPTPAEDIHHVTVESLIGGAKAMGAIASAGIKSPMDFTMSLAKGFHNAPKLYGDETVRKPEKVTGFSSGIVAAGKEFGFGFYDGITGLVTQPMAGAKKEGTAGFIKGAAKGIGGLILKPGAAIWGLPGYTFKGIYTEIRNHFGSSVQNYIIAARTTQGYEEWKTSTAEQRQQIIAMWKSTKLETRKRGKKYGKEREAEIQDHILTHTRSNSKELVSGFKNTRHLSWDERKALAEQKQKLKKEEKKVKRQSSLARRDGKVKSRCKHCPFDHDSSYHLRQTQSFPSRDHLLDYGRSPSRSQSLLQVEYEDAIQKSVTATSRGDPEEDALIERALRASVKELQKVGSKEQDDDVYERAVAASVSEVKKARAELAGKPLLDAPDDPQTDQDDVAELKKVLSHSLEEYKMNQGEHQHRRHIHHGPSGQDWSNSDSGFGTEDDEDFKRALEESKRVHTEREQSNVSDEELKKAITASQEDYNTKLEEVQKQRTEEDIVMEYVKKQSLVEEEHRANLAENKDNKAI